MVAVLNKLSHIGNLQKLANMLAVYMDTRFSTLRAAAILGQTFIYGTYSILVNLSISDGRVPYLPSSLVLCTEILKLVICLGMLWPQYKRKRLPSVTCVDTLLFSIPAICYAVNNNLAFYMQSQMDPTTYMVLGNLKILTTALLYRFIMQTHISFMQWLLLVSLCVSGTLTSLTALNSKPQSLSQTHVTMLGVFLLCSYCTISGFAGVYTEYKLKTKQELSVLHQNVFLYSFGVVFNFCGWIVQTSQIDTENPYYLFSGYSWISWTLVITQATLGLGMGYILKYQGSIVRLFIISSAPIITGILSYFIFNWQPHFVFILASFAVIFSISMYHLEESRKDCHM